MNIPQEICDFLHPPPDLPQSPPPEPLDPTFIEIIYNTVISGFTEATGPLAEWLEDKLAAGHTLSIIEQLTIFHAKDRAADMEE